mmetsp:Transcript_20977/g.50546  ORF Transcript_20977/g.50546 Transcript_20977/m.50546 type:complete len:203 (-) Transcript_20977:633-1241(-)
MPLDPNVLPPGASELSVDGNAPANENPLVPILPPDDTGLAMDFPEDALPSSPGLGVSQATHAIADRLFVTMHTPHFQEPSSEVLNMEPQPSGLTSSPLENTGSSSPASLALPFELSSSDSSSPNNQSTYQSTNAFFVMILSPDDSSNELIFLIVRRCSSSQYVVPIDSKSFPNSDAGIFCNPSLNVLKASSALAFSSAISLS